MASLAIVCVSSTGEAERCPWRRVEFWLLVPWLLLPLGESSWPASVAPCWPGGGCASCALMSLVAHEPE